MIIFCDFDGTITLTDGTDAILQSFALPTWREWERLWENREISSRECLFQQIALIRADRETLVQFAETLPVDPGIFTLARQCTERNIPLTIVSDGLDLVVDAVLRSQGLSHIPFFANHVAWTSEGNAVLEFPYAALACESGSGSCKCAVAGVARKRLVPSVFIGDGRSDFCISAKMDRVYAKGTLRAWCQSQDIPCQAFDRLRDVAEHLFPDEIVVR